MPPETDRRGARWGASAGRAARRGPDRVVAATRGFFEQIGQFSSSRLWRQKVGTRQV
jgi:hypothetical protein